MPPARHLLMAWLGCGVLAVLLCCYPLSATLVDGGFIPADHDSFYHARRILDAIGRPLAVMQFDPAIHAPEGSWVTWPWAYDAMMAAIAGAAMALSDLKSPLTVLVFVAPLWALVNAALLIACARELGLRLGLIVLGLVLFALSPLTLGLHRVGVLDHHFIELSFVLTTVWLGLRWFGDRNTRAEPVALGIVLGAAPAFHNGLFILQLPLLAAMTLLWLTGARLPPRPLLFVPALLGSTLLFLLPSVPFRDGAFEFYLHSGFHLYIAAASAVTVTLLAYLRRGPWSVLLLVAAAGGMLQPILAQALRGGAFISADIVTLDRMLETRWLLARLAAGEFSGIAVRYGGVVFLLPLIIAMLAWRWYRERTPELAWLLVVGTMGAALLLTQYRLHYFGSFVLFLGAAMLAEFVLLRWPRAALVPGAALLAIALFAHGLLPVALTLRPPPGNDYAYTLTRHAYAALGDACTKEPGVVLAEMGDGHYIRFHSACAVIANNFIMTPQHESKLRLTESLLNGTLDGLVERAPYVRYLLVRRADNVLADTSCYPHCADNRGLRRVLLAPAVPADPRLTLLYEVRLRRNKGAEVGARLFRLNVAGG